MLSNFIRSALTDTFLSNIPNISTLLGEPKQTNQSFSEFFKLSKYEPSTKTTTFRYPILNQVNNKYFELSFVSRITFHAASEITKEPIPYIDNNDIISSNFYAQYISLQPIQITITGKYSTCKTTIRDITTPIRKMMPAITALANSMNLPVIPGVKAKINKLLDTTSHVMGQVSDIVTSASNIIETGIQEAEAINNTFNIFNQNLPITEDTDMKKNILSVLALRLSKHPIDLNIGSVVFNNMVLTNYDFEIPYDEKQNIQEFALTFEHITTHNDHQPPVLQNDLKKCKESTTSLSI